MTDAVYAVDDRNAGTAVEPVAPLWVRHDLTRAQWATVLFHSPRWRPGCPARIGQWYAQQVVLADPNIVDRPPPPEDHPRYRAALSEIERWTLAFTRRLPS